MSAFVLPVPEKGAIINHGQGKGEMAEYNVGMEDDPSNRQTTSLAAFAVLTCVLWVCLLILFTSGTAFAVAAVIGMFYAMYVNGDLKASYQRTFAHRTKVKQKIDSTGFVFGKIFDSPEMVFMVSEDLSQALYIDKAFDSHSFSSTDIKAVSVVVDEQTISNFTTGAGGSLAGAGVGGLMFGGVGAIVGAVAGKKQKAINEVKIKSVQIKLAVSKAGSNLVILEFFKNAEGVSKDDTNLHKALANVDEWWATFTVMSDSKN